MGLSLLIVICRLNVAVHIVFRSSKCNSYTMVCPPVRGYNPRALASGLSPVQMDNHWYNYFHTIYISVDLVHYERFSAEVGR